MNLTNKAELKRAIFHKIGCDADDYLEGAKRNIAGFDGAKNALRQSATQVQAIAELVTKDLDDGKLNDMEPIQVAAYAKRQITRAVESLNNQARHFENLQLSAVGEANAFDRMVKHMAKLHDQEHAKIQQIEGAFEAGQVVLNEDGSVDQVAGEPRERVPGMRPPQGIAAQRKAEDAAAVKPPKAAEAPKKTSKKKEEPKKKRRAPPTCGTCGKKGHTSRGCPDRES